MGHLPVIWRLVFRPPIYIYRLKLRWLGVKYQVINYRYHHVLYWAIWTLYCLCQVCEAVKRGTIDAAHWSSCRTVTVPAFGFLSPKTPEFRSSPVPVWRHVCQLWRVPGGIPLIHMLVDSSRNCHWRRCRYKLIAMGYNTSTHNTRLQTIFYAKFVWLMIKLLISKPGRLLISVLIFISTRQKRPSCD